MSNAEFEEETHRQDFDAINKGLKLSVGLFSQPQLKGYLEKQGEKGLGSKPWSKRCFVLADPFLCYFEKDEPSSACKGCIYLRKCVVQELDQPVADHKNCFSLTPLISSRSQSAAEKVTFLLSAPDYDTMRHWLKVLRQSYNKPKEEVLQQEIEEEKKREEEEEKLRKEEEEKKAEEEKKKEEEHKEEEKKEEEKFEGEFKKEAEKVETEAKHEEKKVDAEVKKDSEEVKKEVEKKDDAIIDAIEKKTDKTQNQAEKEAKKQVNEAKKEVEMEEVKLEKELKADAKAACDCCVVQ